MFSYCGVLFAPWLPLLQGVSPPTDARAPGEVPSLPHLVILHQLSCVPVPSSCCLQYSPSSPPVVKIPPLFLSVVFFRQTSPSFTRPYHPYICYSTACFLSLLSTSTGWTFLVVRFSGVGRVFLFIFKLPHWATISFFSLPAPHRVSRTEISPSPHPTLILQ